ncbi:nucleoporin Nup37-like [Scaptodrosophila lebanonensis]|uniref:Nucleoporin Nup37-like n=1 Tax=Drosophila lebanonensis TaxID=7225 RepID=A0A6J2SX85_DROLE|nr:nucleoporin Nup37-like [Scaptodrosophila lebanonensis]
MENETRSHHSYSYKEVINAFAIFHNPFGKDIFCVALELELRLQWIELPQNIGEDINLIDVASMILSDDGARCHALKFSPDTSLARIPYKVKLAAPHGLMNLSVFYTDLKSNTTIQHLKGGHTWFINDVAWACGGDMLASVSDDCCCVVWDLNAASGDENVGRFRLSSEGTAVMSHPTDSNLVIVAEKKGAIQIFNLRTKESTRLIQTPTGPLTSIDWHLRGEKVLLLAALAGGSTYIWDVGNPSRPLNAKKIHDTDGIDVRFRKNCADIMIASVGKPGKTLYVVRNQSNEILLTFSMNYYGGVAWYPNSNYIALAAGKHLHFWKIPQSSTK